MSEKFVSYVMLNLKLGYLSSKEFELALCENAITAGYPELDKDVFQDLIKSGRSIPTDIHVYQPFNDHGKTDILINDSILGMLHISAKTTLKGTCPAYNSVMPDRLDVVFYANKAHGRTITFMGGSIITEELYTAVADLRARQAAESKDEIEEEYVGHSIYNRPMYSNKINHFDPVVSKRLEEDVLAFARTGKTPRCAVYVTRKKFGTQGKYRYTTHIHSEEPVTVTTIPLDTNITIKTPPLTPLFEGLDNA